MGKTNNCKSGNVEDKSTLKLKNYVPPSEEMKDEVILIRRFIAVRKHSELSQRDLAELSGVQQPAIARIEGLQSTPRIDTLIKILKPLGYKLTIVPDDEDDPRSLF